MNLVFPDIDTLTLAITSQTIPESVLGQKASAIWSDDEIVVGASAKISRGVAADLRKLGVSSRRSMPRSGRLEVACWRQLLPLQTHGHTEYSDNTPVLFELPSSEWLPHIVSEMLRLGNDRQSFRHLKGKQEQRTLLRVQGPPYYTLLRALDDLSVSASNGDADAHLRAYVEQASRVWVQLGRRHPLAPQIKPPAGQLLLLSGERDWRFIDEQPFHDIYELIVPQLPTAATSLKDAACPQQVDVPLRLAAGSPNDAPELWVVRERSMEQLEKLVRHSDDHLLSRLSFCVLEREEADEPVIVIRARPSRLGPPVLVLDGVPYRSYAKLKNLYVPVGKRIHPPLRRDTIGQLLAADSASLTWLHPTDDSKFIPESAPDRSFRPLSDWVSYVLDYERQSMKTWIDAHQFDFEPFVCESTKAEKKPPASGERSKQKQKDENREPRKRKAKRRKKVEKKEEFSESDAAERLQVKAAPQELSKLQKQLEQREQEFVASEEPIDSPWREEAWRQLGALNGALGNRLDATLCFSNALWDSPQPSPDVADAWLQYERQIASSDAPLAEDFPDMLQQLDSQPLKTSVLAAYLVRAVATGETDDVLNALGDISQLLHRHEAFLPIRTTWLAWHSLFQISQDSLALARARDRILERLFGGGLAPEANLPSFLRARGAGQTERYRAMLQQVRELQDTVLDWIEEAKAHAQAAKTREYAKLTFAFALARLGETGDCHELTQSAVKALTGIDEIHDWAAAAYEYRIAEAGRSEAVRSLPDELISQLDTMDRMNRFKVDRLRSLSRVLEPHLRVDAFTKWHGSHSDALSEALANLASITDAAELRGKLTAMIHEHAKDVKNRLRILPKALELSPRLGESFARELLESAIAWLDHCEDVVEQSLLLNKSLYIAAHYGQTDAMQSLVNAFYDALPAIAAEYFAMQKAQDSEGKDRIANIENLFTDSFRDLRKMGMRDEIGRLYSSLAKQVQQGQKEIAKQVSGRAEQKKLQARTMRLLLCAASGWYYFGQDEDARKVADQVRARLFESDLPPTEQRGLACAYANAVAQADELEALQRIQEMFQRKKKKRRMDGIADNMTTASHFSVLQLDVIESAVLALVSEDFSLSPESRRWLDEDEFLVRKRIHEDVRQEFVG